MIANTSPRIRWSYMDHWSSQTARGIVAPHGSIRQMDRYIKQIGALGFEGIDTFGRRLPLFVQMFGSLKNFEEFLRERGAGRIVNVFKAYAYVSPTRAPHEPATHANIMQDCRDMLDLCIDLQIENLIVMPSSTYWQTAPVTDAKLHAMADLWSQVGRMTLDDYGVKTTCHHEFWGAVRSWEELDKFYSWTDPACVFFFCDTAQHLLSGVDPIEVYEKYQSRCTGLHFKDTHTRDTEDEYRKPPDPEWMAASTKRWFWEIGAPGGLVDFPAIMRSLKKHDYAGWVSVEHDQAEFLGGTYAESTCVAKWYLDHVLKPIYS